MKTQKNSVRRSLILSATALMISVAMLIGTTFAWFTDSVSSGKNKIVAGNLDVELEYKNGDTWTPVTKDTTLFSALEADGQTDNLWEPGHTEVAYLKITNKGTLALDYKLAISKLNENGSVSVKGNSFKLSDYLVFAGITENAEQTAYANREDAWNAAGAQKGWNSYTAEGEALLAGESKYVTLVIYMPTDVGDEANYDKANGYNAPSVEFGVELLASQAKYEKDSFDDTYDADDEAPGKWADPEYSENLDVIYPANATAPLDESGKTTVIATQTDAAQTEIASAIVPNNALEEGTTSITLSVIPTTADANFNFDADKNVKAFDVKVTNVKSDNSEKITVKLFLGKNLENVTLKHKKADGSIEDLAVNYDTTTGYASFETTSFSDYAFAYDTMKTVSTYNELVNAIAVAGDGDTIALTADMDVAQSIVVENKTIKLNLNGKKLYNTNDLWEQRDYDWSIISVRGTGNLTITGNGMVAAKENDCYAVDVQDGATCTIENGTFIGNIHSIYVKEGTAYVNGGHYSVQQTYPTAGKEYEFVLNLYDNFRVNGTAKMIVTGGTFEKFNPADCWAEGAHTNFCEDGYTTTHDEATDIYTVVEKSTEAADSTAQ